MADSFWPTLAEVKAYLGIVVPDDDDYLQMQMDATVLAIENYCGRWFEAKDDIEQFRLTDFDKHYSRVNGIRLHRVPIASIASIINAPDAGVTFTYKQGESGFIQGNFIDLGEDISVSYRGGFEDAIPADVLNVYYEMMTVRYSLKSYKVPLSGNLKSQAVPGVHSESFYDTGSESSKVGYGLPSPTNFSHVLDSYILYNF